MPDELTPSTNIEKFLAKTAGESVELPEPATRIEQYLNKIASEQSIVNTTESWLAEHINPQTGYAVDNTLSVAGAAADAKATGDAIIAQSEKITDFNDEIYTAENIDYTSATVYNVILSSATGKWYVSNDYESYFCRVPYEAKQITFTANDNYATVIALLKTDSHTNNKYPNYATGESGRRVITAGQTQTFDIPNDCEYIYTLKSAPNENYTPQSAKYIFSKVSVIESKTNSTDVPMFPGGVNRLTGASDFAYDAFWNLRTTPLISIGDSTNILINSNDATDISYFNIYEYGESAQNGIYFIEAKRTLSFTNNEYAYNPQSSVKYIRICLALPSANTKQFAPLKLESKVKNLVCKNPNITDGSKIALSYIVDGETYTSGQLLLPPNYNINGKPCPLIVIFHGTSSMNYWTQEIGTNSGTSTRYLLDYLTNEGFAVFDCYPFTSKYYSESARNQDAPLPIFMQAYTEGIKYVCEQFNVDINNVCAFAMSAGGNLGNLAMHYCGDLKLRALAMLCPTTGFAHLRFRDYFLYSGMRSIIVDYLHLENEENADVFISTNDGMDNATARAFVNDHKDSFAGVICSAIGIHGATFDDHYNWMVTGTQTLPQWMIDLNLPQIPSIWTTSPATGIPSFVDHPELTAYTSIPVKYWQAFDDDAVSGHANFTIYNWLKNGGSFVQWRTLPDGSGGHHAVDTDADALKSSGTTRLGIAYTDIATTYVEMADFFYQFMAR